MKPPPFLRRFLGIVNPPSIASADRTLVLRRHAQNRNRIIDVANEMRARQGLEPIPRREA